MAEPKAVKELVSRVGLAESIEEATRIETDAGGVGILGIRGVQSNSHDDQCGTWN